MAWTDRLGRVTIDGRQLIGASFRNVPFLVESEERAGGRATVTKQFPFRDRPHVEDLGRAPNTFPLEAYVLGDDWLAQRDALLEALQDIAGPGLLVHPSYGALQVICTSFRVRATKREGRMATLALEFAETDAEPASPTVAPDPATLLDESATAAATASGVAFVAQYDDEVPSWALTELGEVLEALTASMDELLSPVMSTAQQLAEFRVLLAELAADAVSLVHSPQDAADRLLEVLLFLADGAVLDRLLQVYDFTPPARPDPEASGTRARQAVNYDELLALVRRGVAIQAARLAPLRTYDSYQAALQVRERVTEQLDEQLEVASDEVYPALQQLRADLVRGVPGEESQLAQLVEYTPPAAVPSLVLAHRLYGPVGLEARELDVLARNHVQHPAFVRGGEPLEVLSSG